MDKIIHKKGDIREDGYIFANYSKKLKKNGEPRELWLSPKVYQNYVKPPSRKGLKPRKRGKYGKTINHRTSLEGNDWKRGDYNPEFDMYFSTYNKSKTEEVWSTEEGIKRDKEHRKKWFMSKGINTHKKYVEINKEILKKKNSIARYKKAETDPIYIAWKSCRSGLKRGKRKIRNLEWGITVEDIKNQAKLQNFLCFYTNIPLLMKWNTGSLYQFSIDRKDSSIGYTKENIVLCCQCINYTKNRYDEQLFKNFIKDIVNYGSTK